MSTNPEVKGNGCWKLQREKGKEGRRKKNRSDDNGERILWAWEKRPRETPTSDPLLSLYIRRISTNEIIKITKLSARRTTTATTTNDRVRQDLYFPLTSPPSLYLGGCLCTHPFARGKTGNGSTGINENSRRSSFEIPLENQRRSLFSPTVVSLIACFASP